VVKDMVRYFVLDESILDLESWLPQSAIDEVVELILQLEEQEEVDSSVSSIKV
jgi:hypothetical protein